MSGIYRITCESNKKQYIGSTKNSFEQRKGNHWTSLKRGDHRNPSLQASWNKYGEESFSWEILLSCDESMLLVEEDRLIEKYNTMSPRGFNLKGAERIVISEETRARMSESKMGEKNNFYGKKHSPETLKILSEKCGHEMTAEHKERMVELNKLKWADPESKYNSADYRAAASNRLKDPNHPIHLASHTPEARAKKSDSAKRRWEEAELTEETREKLRQAALMREASKTPEQKAEISRKISEAMKRRRDSAKTLQQP